MSGNNKWMPFYPGDYLRDTGHLSTAEHGAYLLLLMQAWTNGGVLPANDDRLRRITKMTSKEWAGSRDTLLEFFCLTAEGYRQKRLDRELAKADAVVAKSREDRSIATDRMRRWRQERKLPEREWAELRQEIFARDGQKCVRCGEAIDLHCDHIIPLGNGGTNDPDNLTTLCLKCHSIKTGVTGKRPNGVDPPVTHDVTHNKAVTEASPTALRDDHKRHDVTPLPQVQPEVLPLREEVKEASNFNLLSESTEPRAKEGGEVVPFPETPLEPGSVGPETVAVHIRRVAKACTMSIPYGVVRSRSDQIDAALAPKLETWPSATLEGEIIPPGFKCQPQDPIRTVEEQLAFLRGAA